MTGFSQLVIPPFLKHDGAPLAGPAALAGAARAVGCEVRILDLAADWTDRFASSRPAARSHDPLGDHARSTTDLAAAGEAWKTLVSPLLGPPGEGCASGLDPFWRLCFDHPAVLRAALRLGVSAVADAWIERLGDRRPDLVGLSVTWTGQVVAALALSIRVRARWPGVPVVWGGPWVTVMAREIAADPVYGLVVDGFVAGYAERTFADLSTAGLADSGGWFRAGTEHVIRAREDAPACDFSAWSGRAGALPVETGRGCAWGRCAFCTYPAVEGRHRHLPDLTARETIALAATSGRVVAVKDAYMRIEDLDRFASLAQGRVRWAACTRIDAALDRSRLVRLVSSGLATVEVGVETLDPMRLARLGKPRDPLALEDLLEAASGLDVHLVLNVMFGFPGETSVDAEKTLRVLDDLGVRHPGTRFSTERNLLDVQCASPMGRHPDRWALGPSVRWPWSPSLGWNAPAWRADLKTMLTGHFDARKEAA